MRSANLLRHPAWGRAQETYGEDSFHLGAMGAALGAGIQAHNVIATAKHFALNSMENARFTVDVRTDERTLHEIYLPHFKACVDAGIASVMGAYKKVTGEYSGQHRALLTDILREEWGFTGFLHSDCVYGVRKIYGAAAGLEIPASASRQNCGRRCLIWNARSPRWASLPASLTSNAGRNCTLPPRWPSSNSC